MSINRINELINEHFDTIKILKEDTALIEKVNEVCLMMTECFKNGGQVLFCGNGGSASDSQHLATEFVSRFLLERKALNSEALTTNTSSLTAIANDYAFDQIFARQVEAKGKEGDILVGISTSGNSGNVVEAIKKANEIGIKTIGMIGGKTDCKIYEEADISLCMPSKHTPRIQEMHILIGHIICELVELDFKED